MKLKASMRPMEKADLKRVANIEFQVSPAPWSRRLFSDCLNVGYDCQVLEGQNGVFAFSIVNVVIDEAHLLNLAVDPEHQRRGHGRHLLYKAWQVASHAGAQRMFLEVRVSNARAIRVYERFGFNEVGRRRNYYQLANSREDAVVMSFQLDNLYRTKATVVEHP